MYLGITPNKRQRAYARTHAHMEAEVGRKAVGDFKLDLPPVDPALGMEEMQRRNGIVSEPGPETLLPPDVMAKRREAFEAEYSGYWIINCANSGFSTKCECPNIRLLKFVKANACTCAKRCDGLCEASMRECNVRADTEIRAMMMDPRVTSIPIKIQSQTPFQIPYSEASAVHAGHTLRKIQRNFERYATFLKYRNEEFKKHVDEKVPGETGQSTYSRRKAYLLRQKLGEQARDGRLESAKIPAVTTTGTGTGAGAGAGTESDTLTGSAVAAPPPVWTDALPTHWLAREAGTTVIADTWPRDLESRHGRFGVLAFVDDDDEAHDSEFFPEAAKREPIVILMGEMHESVDIAKEFLLKRISQWCPDLVLDVVDMYEWLWPTEVDPDAVKEQHRTQHAGFDKELNTVMSTRKNTLSLAADARQQAITAGTPLRENNVNSIPDISSVVSERRSGMISYELTAPAAAGSELPSI